MIEKEPVTAIDKLIYTILDSISKAIPGSTLTYTSHPHPNDSMWAYDIVKTNTTLTAPLDKVMAT